MIVGYKMLRNLAVVAASAAAIAVASPAGAAHAINAVDCGRDDFLQVSYHTRGYPYNKRRLCLANAGTSAFGAYWYVDQISTGNNDIEYHDANGTDVRIARWTIMNFPNRPPRVKSITIL